MKELNDFSTFTAKVRRSGGSLQITVDNKVVEFEGIEEEDFVKIWIKKLPKKEVTV